MAKNVNEGNRSEVSPGISVLVPVYNSAELVGDVVSGIVGVLANIDLPGEVILVNDGSVDGSWESIRTLCRRYPCVRGVNLLRNYGQHNALLCAIRMARYDACVTMDDDGQHPPEHIPVLLNRLHEGYDVVYGTPVRPSHGCLRNAASLITKMTLRRAMGAATAERISALRAFRTHLRKAFATYSSPFASIDVLLTWGTGRFTHIPLEHLPRRSGTSNYTFRMLLTHALNMMTGFTILPLQLAIGTGFAMALFGLLVLAFVLGRFFISGRVVPGFAFLASIIAIFSGAQLFALGIFGEYLARMHFRIMEKPTYTVGEICGGPDS